MSDIHFEGSRQMSEGSHFKGNNLIIARTHFPSVLTQTHPFCFVLAHVMNDWIKFKNESYISILAWNEVKGYCILFDSSYLIILKEAALSSMLKPQEKTHLTSLSWARSPSALHLSLFHAAPSLL